MLEIRWPSFVRDSVITFGALHFLWFPKQPQEEGIYNFSFADGENGLERLISNTIWGYWVRVAFRRRVRNSFTYNCSPFSILSSFSVKTKSQLSGTHSSGRNPSQRGRWERQSQVGWHSRTWGPGDTGWKCGTKEKIVVTLFTLTLTQFLGCNRRYWRNIRETAC